MNYETYPGKTIIGSCSLCGGPVAVHTAWMATIPDTPTCQRCGATKVQDYGPVIPMTPYKPQFTVSTKVNGQ